MVFGNFGKNPNLYAGLAHLASGLGQIGGAAPNTSLVQSGTYMDQQRRKQQQQQKFAEMMRDPKYASLLPKSVQGMAQNGMIDPATYAQLAVKNHLAQQRMAQGPGPTSYGKNANYVQGPDGKYYTVHVGSDGSRKLEPLPEGMAPWRGVTTIDQGNQQQVISRGTGQEIRSVPKNLREAEVEKGLGRNEAKVATARPLEKAKLVQGDQQLKVVDQDIDRALKQASGWTTGTSGALLSNVWGTPSYDLSQTLETIRANIGFDKLQAMRNASPTGGALGQVSEFENRLLQSVQGALQQGQSKGQLVSNLRRVQRNLRALQRERRRAYEKQYGKADFSTAYTNPKQSQSDDGFSIRRID